MSISKEIEVKANVGLHARPAAEFVKLAQQFNSSVKLDMVIETLMAKV